MFYKKLDINNHELLTKEAHDFVLSQSNIYNRSAKINLITANLNDALSAMPSLNIFDDLDIKITKVLFFVLYDNRQCGIHSDSWHNSARINVPVLNCKDSVLQFWSEVEWYQIINAQGTAVQIGKDGTGKLECEVVIDKPTVVSVNKPHRVVMKNNSAVPRITLSLDFNKCPSFLLTDRDG
jgi:hypothetical protein